jgi:hypothetical protein
MKTIKLGQRVQYRSGGNWKPFGIVIDIQGEICMNGTVLISSRYKVRWDDEDESGWLSEHDLKEMEGTK